MIISTNIMALNASNRLSINQANVENSIQRLASGFRINSAADDAAGLAISEKMRAQIRGLNQAQANAQDGISLLQTAEGALQQTTDILQRMRELVIKSQNTGVLTNADKTSIQNELSTLKDEIDRIAASTTFNGKKLLDGVSLSSGNSGTNEGYTVGGMISAYDVDTSGLEAGKNYDIYFQGHHIIAYDRETRIGHKSDQYFDYALDTLGNPAPGTYDDFSGVITWTIGLSIDFGSTPINPTNVTGGKIIYDGSSNGVSGNTNSIDVSGNIASLVTAGGINISNAEGKTFSVSAEDTDTGRIILEDIETGQMYYSNETANLIYNSVTPYFDSGTYTFNDLGSIVIGNGSHYRYRDLSGTIKMNVDQPDQSPGAQSSNGESTFDFKIGSSSSSEDVLSIALGNMRSDGLVKSGKFSIDISNRESADQALKDIDEALDKVSSERAKIGTLQNRMEYAISNLSVTAENLSAAESRIRDVDMAEEMVRYTKNSILNQTAMAMLAQANKQPEAILSLLQD